VKQVLLPTTLSLVAEWFNRAQSFEKLRGDRPNLNHNTRNKNWAFEADDHFSMPSALIRSVAEGAVYQPT
jgi:hypothetical protein